VDYAPTNFAELQKAAPPVQVPFMDLTCANGGVDTLMLNRTPALPRVVGVCEAFAGQNISAASPKVLTIPIGLGEKIDFRIGANTACPKLDNPYSISSEDCNGHLTEILSCDRGGNLTSGCFVYKVSPENQQG
jgi:hypothetical protein